MQRYRRRAAKDFVRRTVMAYTDKQMRAFTQIAYADFTQAYDYLKTTTGRDSFTIAELEGVTKAINPSANLDMLYCVTPEEKMQWRISAVHDTSPNNGFYGCIIETAPGEATLAFRGSNAADDPSALVHDWIGSDFGLLGSLQTRQQAEADRFLAKYKNQINSYDSINLTGHSLGGNLAEYAALQSHKYGFDDKVDRCVSLDGPGFSHNFIAAHIDDINRMKGKMTHYRWSPIGYCLFTLPGVEYIDVSVSNEANTKDDDKDIGTLKGVVYRHDTKYLDFDENGNFIRGEHPPGGGAVELLSRWFDCLPGSHLIGYSLGMLSFIWGTMDTIADFFGSLGEGAVTLYKNIVKGIKQFLHRANDYFCVNVGFLQRDAEGLRGRLDSIRNDLNEMYAALSAVNGMWTGSANQAFVEKFAQERSIIKDYLKEVDGYVWRIERDAASYISCEQRACEQVASIKV